MAKWIKPGVYTKEVDLSHMPFYESLESYLNSFMPKMFYNIQYKSPEEVYILVPKELVDEVRKKVKGEIRDLISGEIVIIKVKPNGDY